MAETANPQPGFQGSETSGAEVIFYPQKGDPIAVNSSPVTFEGRTNRDQALSLIGVETQKQLGPASGTWSVTLRPGRREIGDSFFDQLVDDDWVDIVLRRHGRRWHVMRGLLDNIQRQRMIGGSGATSTAFTLSGRDFGKIFETTPVWFNPYSQNALGGEAAAKTFGIAELVGNPQTAVYGFLFEFFKLLQGAGQATWAMPNGMPNTRGASEYDGPDFINSVVFPFDLWEDLFTTVGINPNFLMPQGTLWELAKDWSDGLFNEMFVDLAVPFIADPTEGWGVDDTEMRVTFRNRPFPTLLGTPDFFSSDFVLHTVPRHQIVEDQVGRGGGERFNAYFAAPQLLQETLKINAVDALLPLWDRGDINRHGLRRFDVSTKYASANAQDLIMSEAMRQVVRDWYCMNPYLLSGSFGLAIGRPDIQIGSRIRIPGLRDESEDETYYIESVGHSWRYGSGTKTNLGVTRGWRGTDDAYRSALSKISGNYTTGRVQASSAPQDFAVA